MSTTHETALFKAFILPNRRDRYINLLKNAKGRAKLLTTFAHFKDLDPRYAHRIPPGAQQTDTIAADLRQRGAPSDCYVMSELRTLDSKTLPLSEALDAIVGYGMGSFISCLPGKLAYFEGEEPGERYILERAV
jgi:hypothetical protein